MTLIIPEWFAWFFVGYLILELPLTIWKTRLVRKQIALKKKEIKMLEGKD